jgi:hypothetical protein
MSARLSRLIASIHPAPLLAAFPFLLSFGPNTFAQSRGVPYDRSFGPGFYEILADREYPGSYEGIKAVDFRNLRLDILDESKRVLLRAELANGQYDSKHEGTWNNVKLDFVYYLPSEDLHRQFALVLYTWFSAGGTARIRKGWLRFISSKVVG